MKRQRKSDRLARENRGERFIPVRREEERFVRTNSLHGRQHELQSVQQSLAAPKRRDRLRYSIQGDARSHRDAAARRVAISADAWRKCSSLCLRAFRAFLKEAVQLRVRSPTVEWREATSRSTVASAMLTKQSYREPKAALCDANH